MPRVAFLESVGVRLAGLILLISGATLIALTELNRRAVERILRQDAEVQATLAIAGVADGLESGLGAIDRMVRLAARSLEGARPGAPELERIARNLLVDSPNIHSASVTLEPEAAAPASRMGMAVQRTSAPARFVTLDLATPEERFWERDWYQESIARGLPVWTEPFFDRDGSGRNMVRFSAPFFRTADDERPSGVVSVVVELEWLRRLANMNDFADTTQVIVFSRTGRVVLHPRPNFAIAETMASLADRTSAPELNTIWQNVVARRQGALTFRDGMSGRRLHASYRPVRATGWGVLVAYDEAEFLESQTAFRSIALASLAATLLLLAGIVIGVTRLALRPLAPLAAATGEIARGNLDCEIPAPPRPDEIGRLTHAFKSMRDSLKAQHLERRWADQSIQHQLRYNQLVIDSIGELVFVLTKALNVSRINPAVTRVTGYGLPELLKARLDKIVRLEGAASGDLATMTAALDAGRNLDELPAVLLARDGVKIPAKLAMVPMLDGIRVVGAVVTLRVAAPSPRPAT